MLYKMSGGIELTKCSSYATMNDLKRVEQQNQELKVKCQKFEDLMQKFQGENDPDEWHTIDTSLGKNISILTLTSL